MLRFAGEMKDGFLGKWVLLLPVLSILFLLLSCSREPIKRYVRTEIDISTINTIAVLPLNNYTSDKHAHEKIRSKLNIELLSRGINVVEPGEIGVALKDLKIRSVSTMSNSEIVEMGNILKADAVITGAVEAYGISKGITVSYPEVSIYIMMFDTTSGEIAWSVWHTNGGATFGTRHFGAEGRTVDDVTEQVTRELVNTLY